jgi:hypothetical protein
MSINNVFSQNKDERWKIGGSVGLNTSQVSFTNWAQGGQNTISGLGHFNIKANYTKNKWLWENYLKTEYGLTQQGNEITKKTNDLIDFKSKINRSFNKYMSLTILGGFKTQYTKGYDYDKNPNVYISDFMAPAYTIIGIGVDYRPTNYLSIYVSPATYKQTYVGDDTLAYYGAFGVQKQEIESGNIINYKNIRHEIGAYVDIFFKKDVFKNVNIASELNLYSNYISHPENIDVNWTVEILMKVNSFLNASIKTHLIYDDDIPISDDKKSDGTFNFNPKLQFMEAISVGIYYKFGAKE